MSRAPVGSRLLRRRPFDLPTAAWGLALGLACSAATGCGESEKPAPRSAGSARGGDEDRRPVASASLTDSALEPAAQEALKAEDWPRAESASRELARRQPRNPAGKRSLGLALMKQGKNDQAVEALQGSLEIGDDAHTRLLLAETFVGMGRAPSALPHVRKAVKMVPAEPAAWAQLADVLVKVDKPDGAADALLESRESCPACAKDEDWGRAADAVAEGLCAKAEKQLAADDVAGARKSADVAAALRPDRAETHLIEGKLARAAGDKKAAIAAYRKALEGLSDATSEPGATARLELAGLLGADGDGAEAVKLAREVVAVRSNDGHALDVLGRACDATQDTDCARKTYDKLSKLSPGSTASKEEIEHARQRMKELKKTKGKGKAKKKGKSKRR